MVLEFNEFPIFFDRLSDREQGENALSNILVSAMDASHDIRDKVFRELGIDYHQEYEIKREHYVAGVGRPDILIYREDEYGVYKEQYIIEVKIWDRDYHESKYLKLLEDQSVKSLVLLTAHKPNLISPERWRIVLWEDLAKILKEVNTPLSECLTAYIEKVAMINYEQFDYKNGLRCLKDLTYLLDDAISEVEFENNGINITRRTIGRSSSELGYYFYLEGDETDLTFWIGVRYEDNTLETWVNNSSIEQRLKTCNRESIYHGNAYGVFKIAIKLEEFIQMDKKGQLETCKHAIQDFVNEVLVCLNKEG